MNVFVVVLAGVLLWLSSATVSVLVAVDDQRLVLEALACLPSPLVAGEAAASLAGEVSCPGRPYRVSGVRWWILPGESERDVDRVCAGISKVPFLKNLSRDLPPVPFVEGLQFSDHVGIWTSLGISGREVAPGSDLDGLIDATRNKAAVQIGAVVPQVRGALPSGFVAGDGAPVTWEVDLDSGTVSLVGPVVARQSCYAARLPQGAACGLLVVDEYLQWLGQGSRAECQVRMWLGHLIRTGRWACSVLRKILKSWEVWHGTAGAYADGQVVPRGDGQRYHVLATAGGRYLVPVAVTDAVLNEWIGCIRTTSAKVARLQRMDTDFWQDLDARVQREYAGWRHQPATAQDEHARRLATAGLAGLWHDVLLASIEPKLRYLNCRCWLMYAAIETRLPIVMDLIAQIHAAGRAVLQCRRCVRA
jgi:hypothetical protein